MGSRRAAASSAGGCGTTVICGDGGGGTPPDVAAYSSGLAAYGWSGQSYAEKWDTLSGTLLKQSYFAVGGGLLQYSLYYCDGVAGSGSLPAVLPTDGSWYYSSDGNIAGSVNGSNSSFSIVNSAGGQITGYVTSNFTTVATLSLRNASPVSRSLAPPTRVLCNPFKWASMVAAIFSVYLWGDLMHDGCDPVNEADVDLCDFYNAVIEVIVEERVEAVLEAYGC